MQSMSEIVKIGNATLYHGDCREILPSLPKVDLVLTDPPYGVSNLGSFNSGGRGWGNFTSDVVNDFVCWDSLAQSDIVKIAINQGETAIVWGGNYFDVPPSRCWLCWVKPDSVNSQASIELAWTNMNKNAKHFVLTRNPPPDKAHPTQKPVRLMEWCLDLAPKTTSTVADPFAGSGTTGVACANMGKTFYGIERERKYFDIACERIERAYAQQRLFA